MMRRGALDFGWIVASLLNTQQWANLNHDCNALLPYRHGTKIPSTLRNEKGSNLGWETPGFIH